MRAIGSDLLVGTGTIMYNTPSMIYYLVTKVHAYTMGSFLASPEAESIRDRIKIVPYQELRIGEMNSGVYIFSDIERLSDHERAGFARAFEALSSAPAVVWTLNHPGRVWRRFQLLSELRKTGINDFAVHPLKSILLPLGGEPIKFPVFVRGENDHSGPLTHLITSYGQLWATVPRLLLTKYGGIDDKIITEFCNTSDKDGVFRKYSAFRVNDVIIPRHLFFSDQWAIKVAKISDEAKLDEEIAYIEENPHKKELMNIFRMASIEYGRIDYGLKDGKIHVWEINTNPMLVSAISHYIPERARVHEIFVRRILKTFEMLNTKIVIRKMLEKDVDQAFALLSKWNMAPVAASPEIPDPERSTIEIDNSFVAVHNERVVGLSSYIMLSDSFAETASLAVDPDFRGGGTGFRLQTARLSEMHRRGVKLVRTETDRPETIEWYKANFGYREVGKNKKKHGFSLSEVDEWTVLELDLDCYFDRRNSYVSG